MIKMVAFLTRKEGLSSAQFREYYESQHTKLFEDLLKQPGVERYVRRYLTPIPDPIYGEIHSSGFDVVMEVWVKDRAVFDSHFGQPLPPEFRDRIASDEENIFDRDKMFFHTVEEVDTPIPHK